MTIEVADAGDFEKDQPFSFGAWVKLAKADASGAASSPAWTTSSDYRGWDLWVENGRLGTHIINKWQDDALKVVANEPLKAGQWSHVLVTYDGSGKAGGVKVYVNGQPQGVRVVKDQLKNTIRTDGAAEDRPAEHAVAAGRHRASRPADLRPHAQRSRKSSSSSPARAWPTWRPSPPTSGPTPRRTNCSPGG